MKSARDRWLVALMPALFLVCWYVWAKATPAERELKALRESAANRTVNPGVDELLKMQQEMDGIERQLTEEHAREAGASDRARATPQALPSPDRTRTLQALSALCESEGAMLVASTRDQSGKLPASLAEAGKKLYARHPGTEPEIWTLDVNADYASAVRLLEKMAATEHFVVPLGVTMRPKEDGSINWVFTLWI
jgi:hypothetical protein